MVAVMCGACQQAVTRYIDQRAEAILSATQPSPKVPTH
jgi:hypothetical protein